ncbi:hypothetical protein HYDPIDRAFT_30509 [Hydnomerulius pinastri MD-312]|uniref:Uncharacterized protein n=1 Tax=Hydnomerulius pinastri MD-312 TaxID=994086 RepID=A0A0C9VVT7_9AGAM|nr:hypothetical protein HYDPIDRAFT_30509 [Hydnomerulius pinastri MD-312]
MYASASGYRTPGRPRQRSRTQSDPGHPYVTAAPYTVQWPAPARRTTEPMPMGMSGMSQRSPSRSSSVERTGDPFVPHPGSLLAQYQMSGSPAGTGPSVASTPVSPRSQSPQRSGHQRSSSKQGSIRMPQAPLIKDVPQPSRTALNTPPVMPTPQLTGLGQQGSGYAPAFPVPQQQIPPAFPAPTPFQGAAMAHQGSYQSVVQQHQFSAQQNASATQLTHHASYGGSADAPRPSGHHHSNSYHSTHHRSRSRPPSAASHRYASSITQPVYGHGSSATLNASKTSLNAGGTPPKSHHVSSPPPGVSASSNRNGANPSNNIQSGSQGRSRSRTRPNAASTTTATTTTAHSSKLKETQSSAPAPTPAAKDIHHTTQRPAFPAGFSGQTQTRYVNMLLALDDIPPLFNLLASFFTWILLAGFVLFPGTFASWKNQPAGDTESQILGLIDNIPLYVIAWVCTGIGATGMLWLWWRWQNNYIWVTNRIFVPGLLNSLAGVISTLTSVYGAQAGTFSTTAKSTIIVTGAVAVICGLLMLIYQFWLLGNIKKEHDRQVGVERAGRHGEGVLGEKKTSRRREV